jgi:hypothetical protein
MYNKSSASVSFYKKLKPQSHNFSLTHTQHPRLSLIMYVDNIWSYTTYHRTEDHYPKHILQTLCAREISYVKIGYIICGLYVSLWSGLCLWRQLPSNT